MVYYFKSNLVDPPAFIYVGKDKEESEFFPYPRPSVPPSLLRLRGRRWDGGEANHKKVKKIRLLDVE